MRQLVDPIRSPRGRGDRRGVSLLVVTLGRQGRRLRGGAGVRWLDGRAERRYGARTRHSRRRARRRPPLRPCGPPSSRRPASRRSIRPAAATSSARRRSRVSSPATGWKTRLRHANAHGRPERRLSRRRRTRRPPPRRAGDAMTRVVEVPAHFDDRSFDQFAAGFGAWPPEEKLLIDARGAQWASPYGLIGMLTAGQALAEAKRERPLLHRADERRGQELLGPGGLLSRTPPSCSSCTGRCPRRRHPARPTCCWTSRRSGRPRTCTKWWKDLGGRVAHPARRARAGDEGDAGLHYGAFGGVPEYCGARRHRRLGGGAGVHLPAPARPAGRGHRGERRRDRVPPLARKHPRQAVRRSLGRRRGARGGPDPGREPLPRSGPGPGTRLHQAVPGPVEGQDLRPERHRAARDRPAMGRRRTPRPTIFPSFPEPRCRSSSPLRRPTRGDPDDPDRHACSARR